MQLVRQFQSNSPEGVPPTSATKTHLPDQDLGKVVGEQIVEAYVPNPQVQ